MALVLDAERAAAPARRPSRSWPSGWRLAGWCTALAVLTRLPGLLRTGVLNPDEGFLATQAKVLNGGGQLYRDIVDRKPPLVPVLYALAFRLTGSDSLLSVRLLAVVAHVATALLVAAIARRRWSDRAGVAAALLYLVAAVGFVPADGQAANFEVFMVPFTAAAVLLALEDRTAGSGVAAAFATLGKQVGGATLLPVAWLTWRRRGARRLPTLLTAFISPVALAALWFGARDFLYWVFDDSNGYLDPSGSWGVSIRRGIVWTLIFAAANLAAVLLADRAWARRRDDVELWLWLAGAAVGVSAGLRFFGHYYLQLAPPLALLAAGALEGAPGWIRRRTAALGALSVAVFMVMAVATTPTILRPTARLRSVIDANSAPGQPIFVWGEVPQVYWDADRPPASRFLTVGFLTGYSGGRANDQIGPEHAVPGAWDDLFADLAARPPALIIDESPGTPYSLQHFPAMERYVRTGYRTIAAVDGAVVYARST